MIIFTILLNSLCAGGLSVISWIIVFIPFILMTYITAILLYVFGLSPEKGRIVPDPRKKKHQPIPHQVGGCAGTQFGCCLDGKTAKQDFEGSNCYGAKPVIGGCGGTQFGCCPNGKTAKVDIQGSNC